MDPHLVPLVVIAALVAFAVLLEAWAISQLRRLGYTDFRNVIVRCADGHLFATAWIPGISFKAVRLGLLRYQYCPVGQHWAVVQPVDPATLSAEERAFALSHHDTLLP